jgi:hypothetical protein
MHTDIVYYSRTEFDTTHGAVAMTQTHSTMQVFPAMRWLLVGAVGLVILAAIPLFFFSASTEQFFAWTIQPPLSAAFLGAD